jgi:hypothetical protein
MIKKTYLAILAVFVVGLTGTVAFADVPDHVDLPDPAERAAAFQPHVVRSNGIVATFVPAMTTFGDPSNFEAPSEGSALLVISSTSSSWGCSGTLISANKILTAAHCVANSRGIVDATSGTAYLGNVPYNIVDFVKHKNFDGRFWKGYDLAIVTIDTNVDGKVAIDEIDDTVGKIVEIHGYGVSGTGDDGATLPFGTHRIGQNTIDAYGEVLYDYIGMKANKDYKRGAVLHSDFDNLNSDNDGFGVLFGSGSDYADLGLGMGKEAKVCSGDSGGSIRNLNGEVTGVNSYTIHIENEETGEKSDIDDIKFNCSFGEFTGYMNVPYHADWINSQLASGGDDGGGGSVGSGEDMYVEKIDWNEKRKGPGGSSVDLHITTEVNIDSNTNLESDVDDGPASGVRVSLLVIWDANGDNKFDPATDPTATVAGTTGSDGKVKLIVRNGGLGTYQATASLTHSSLNYNEDILDNASPSEHTVS